MLENIRHWHLATKRFPALRESRLLWFASADDGQNPTIPESESGTPAESNDAQGDAFVGDITKRYRGRLDAIGLKLAEAVAASPFTLNAALDELMLQEERGATHTPEMKELMEQARRYLDDDRSPEKQVELRQKIEAQLNDPVLAYSVTTALDLRVQRYDELMQQIGDVRIADIIAEEKKLPLAPLSEEEALQPFVTDTAQGQSPRRVLSAESLTDAQVDDLIVKLKIETEPKLIDTAHLSAEERRAVEAMQKEIDAAGPLTKEDKVRLIEKKIIAAKKLAIMEQADFSSESTVEDSNVLRETIVKHTVHARRHLERMVKLRAAELKDKWDTYNRAVIAEAGSDNHEVIAAHLKCDPQALEHRHREVDAILVQATRQGLTKQNGGDGDDPENLPRISDAEFTRKAKTMLDRLSGLSWLTQSTTAEQTEGFTRDIVSEREHAEAWLAGNARKVQEAAQILTDDPDALTDAAALLSRTMDTDNADTYSNAITLAAGVAERAASGKATAEDIAIIHEHFPTYKRRWWEQFFLVLSSPSYKRQLQKDIQHIESDTTVNTPASAETALSELKVVEDLFFENGSGSKLTHPALTHNVCTALPVHDELSRLFRETEQKLRSLPQLSGPKADAMLRECRLTIDKCNRAVRALDTMQSKKHIKMIRPADLATYVEKSGGSDTSVGCYHRGERTIYLNEQALLIAESKLGKSFDEIKNETIYHEQGHAVLHVLMHQTGLLPNIQLAFGRKLADTLAEGDNAILEDVLRGREEAWGVHLQRQKIFDHALRKATHRHPGMSDEETKRIAERETDARIRELMIDELANKYASYKFQNETPDGFSKEDIALFKALDGQPEKLQNVKFDTEAIKSYALPDEIDTQLQSDLDLGDDASTPPESGEAGDGALAARLIGSRIVEMQNSIMLVDQFIANHQNTDGKDAFEQWVNTWKKHFSDNIKDPFYSSKKNGEAIPEDVLEERLNAMDEHFFGHAKKQMDAVTQAEMNDTNASGKKGLWNWITSHELASVNDVISMFKSMGEDLQRMWKRRAERVQSLMGYNLTSWFPDNNLIALRYAGQLKHEFERRQSASEVEEVKQWKDSLGDLDSYTLMDKIGVSRNKDEVRAIAELLTERGRMDMNNVGMWNTLKALSGLPMPIEACRDNSILRDRWLQKMITAIWSDTDKFNDWRQSNDSGIDGGKKKFTQMADQLSNLKGGLAKTLNRQLRLWVENKDSGPIPEEVNPHLYEEVLHYSMRNGKMSMEDKLFYLVQGTRYGLISIDRLQALAGQNGGVLNVFPFIDYFYGKNNTWPEIDALGHRLEESHTGDGRFEPGPKTTLWLHMELLRNESARQRISKATSGTRAENIDHEDIPTILAQGDYKTIDRLTDIVSGSREKLSPEATRNAYTGFGTKFRLLARLAQLDELGEARFTEADALEAAKSITAYIHMDNIFTRNGNDKSARSEISWSQFELQAPSSAGLKSKIYRETNNSFVQDFVGQLGSGVFDNTKTSLNDYIRHDQTERKDDDQKRNYNATRIFEVNMIKALQKKENINLLKKILIAHADDFHEENYDDQLKLDVVRNYLSERKQHGALAQAA